MCLVRLSLLFLSNTEFVLVLLLNFHFHIARRELLTYVILNEIIL